MSPEPEKVQVEVEGRSLVLTNLAKVLYPETGFTKGAVIDYYLRAAPVLLPHIADRPLTLRRYPDGVTGQHFYNKHAPDHRPDWIRTERLPAPGSTSGRDWVRYVIAGDLPTLIWTANLAGLELHTPMWRIPDVAQPDLLVFDLDPGAPATIVECCAVRCGCARCWRRRVSARSPRPRAARGSSCSPHCREPVPKPPAR